MALANRTAAEPTSGLGVQQFRHLNDPGRTARLAALKKEIGGGAHGVLITAPSVTAFQQGVGLTRKCGTCVLIGLPPGEFPVPLFATLSESARRTLRIRASRGGASMAIPAIRRSGRRRHRAA